MAADKLSSALAYANYGIAVFPCHHIEADRECSCGKLKCPSAGKHPIPKGWQAEATLDENEIRRMWQAYPDANIGVACGEGSGLTVLDVDGDLGRETLRDLELEHGELPETPIAITGSGGNHYYFQFEPSVSNAVRFAPGLDIRTQGGLVIGVGSKTRREYAWEAIAPLSYELQPSKMPGWLVALIATKPNTNGNSVHVPPEPLHEGEGRNNLLFRLARSEHARGFPDAAVEAAVKALNQTFKPPLDQSEINQLIANALRIPNRSNFQPTVAPRGPINRGKMAEEFDAEKVLWLWPGYIPLGKLSDLQGDPGQGKSVVTASLAAIVSRGLPFPTGDQCSPAGVIMISAEDDPHDTIRPRLEAAGADLARVMLFTLRDDELLSFPEDLDLLREAIKKTSAGLVIIDPLDAFITDEINANQNQSIRKLLAKLAKLAGETMVAIMVVRHLNKDAKTTNPMYRGGGSIGLNAASRQVLLVGTAPDDPKLRVLAPIKENLAPLSPSLGYRVVGADLESNPEINTAKVEWCGEVQYDARTLLQEPEEPGSSGKRGPSGAKVEAVIERLRDILSDGCEHEAKEVEAELKTMGASHGTIWNARKKLGVRARRKGFGGAWMIAMPNSDSTFQNDDDSNF